MYNKYGLPTRYENQKVQNSVYHGTSLSYMKSRKYKCQHTNYFIKILPYFYKIIDLFSFLNEQEWHTFQYIFLMIVFIPGVLIQF